ncbi:MULTISPECIES: amino acid permease [Geobacillus]|jgi:arginine/ornithine permease|uniref:amino acid permease n=1 Tax=Geobacillus TaxID=129337 RepID=UPI00017E631E|nr:MULTISPECIES: amino acid permease [Geobacillus]ARA97992.1 amino acid permease [Geobacillus thermodenitrificans]ARP41212.1 Putative histidine permease [Geobacillus thermodenitrificans]ATO37347.1 amino acid permease [Geobacillus thermodenitrificans]KQB94826.1 Amino-acid permease RocC [Geobacillus sp. PA-3]MEC5189491.1 arginine/ornithine permease [Geobacillus thermodenitrificans]
MPPAQELKRELKSRHLFMIALGGVIGTGLFLGSGYTIHEAGPGGAIAAYLFGGFVMYLTMLSLGELAVRIPDAGSYQTYATKFISPAAGFCIGWLSWLNWSVTVGIELLTVSILMKRWFPDVPTWVFCAVFALLLFLVNALSVKGFAEVEFWFSSVKVLTVIAFIVLGLAAMFGIVHMKSGQPAPFFSNFTDHGGLFPNGFWAIFTTMILVNFSFQGTELVGVAAGESREPEKTVPIALRNTVWRILIFFVLAIFVLAGLFPWEKAGVVESPFVVVFDNIGIPYAADIMNFVIITAVLSVANSGLYATSRVLWSMSRQGMVTPFFSKLSKRGVPINALIASIAIGCLSLLCSVYAEDTVYVWLTAIAGFGAVTVWASIALSSYLGRKAFLREGGDVRDLKYRTPLYPFVPLAAFILNMAIIVGLAFIPDQRIALYCGIPFLLVCYAYYHLVAKKRIHLQRTEEEVELKAAK